MDVKRFPAVPCADILGCEDIDDIQLTDIEQCVSASDFDAALKDRDALQGKLKVAVDALVDIACGNHDNAFVRSAIEALAQIGLPEKEVGCS